jgi:hypothetical protein
MKKIALFLHLDSHDKNQPMEHLSLCAIRLNDLWIWMRRFLQTLSGVLSKTAMMLMLGSLQTLGVPC